MKSFPRFCSYLRSNTDLETEGPSQTFTKTEIQNARKELMPKLRRPEYIVANSSIKIKMLFKELRKIVTESMGSEEKPETIDFVIMYFLRLFMDQELLQRAHVNNIRSTFGAVFDGVTKRLFDVVTALSECIGEEGREVLRKEEVSNGSDKLGSFWGLHVTVKPTVFQSGNILRLQDISPSNSERRNKLKLSMAYTADDSSGSSNQYDQKLMELGNSAAFEHVYELLHGMQNCEEIQNELLEVIGFENFEFASYILENREFVLAKFAPLYKAEKRHKKKGTVAPKRPTVATAVVVQSQLEKELNKQNRRDEKKIQRLQKNDNISDDLVNTTINPIKLRLQQQRKLIENVKQQPILNTQKPAKIIPQTEVQNYPYVFDSQLLVKQHAAFIGGGKMTLPESAERIDTKQYEEVKIPASEPPQLTVGNNRIQIKDLDDIGKLAFRNIEQLNRIQTVVFPSAYHSNNNLLICAPTGAGKTNIAMLAMLATIRSNIENGDINRDAFKIIYIAPMKALAAEMVTNFSERLKPLKIVVRELTGDMQLTKAEMKSTQILVTTPEKWDVVTRKGAGDVSIISLVRLLIIDEVHLLHGERGPVVEALVARTLRLVESSQSMIRIVGLSATLPNYIDVAHFLRVNPMKGLFYFDHRFRPVPLDMSFVGIKAVRPLQQLADMDIVCYAKCLEMVQKDHQVMVFVHARNATVRTATMIREMAQQKNHTGFFVPKDSAGYKLALRHVSKCKNKQLADLFQCGVSIHHAGILRADRGFVEKAFADGYIKVLVCTATLAWGVNLPAHAVIIKGTDIYDAKHGSFTDLGILDVLQIFGRAGRPQYNSSGVGTIITTHDKLNHYLSLLTNQFPIESNFIQCLADNLNAEIASGTVTNVDEAIEWLSYTYLFVRMRINPHCYGIEYSEIQSDCLLEAKRRALIVTAAMSLDKAKMIRFSTKTNDFNITELGRTASHFYIKYDTVGIFNELLKPFMTEAEIFGMLSQAQEFQQLKVRDDELEELDDLRAYNCKVSLYKCAEPVPEKVNVLLQTYLSRGFVKSFSLVSDMLYIVQNIVRITRAVFNIVLRNNNAILAGRMLQMSQMFEKQMWNTETPLRQFPTITHEAIDKLESRGLSVFNLKEMKMMELNEIIRNQRYSANILKCANELPFVDVNVSIQPITRTILRITLELWPTFTWNDRVHGKTSEDFWLWIEDPETNHIYHSEYVRISRMSVIKETAENLVLTIPLREPLPSQYYIRITSDMWLGSKTLYPMSFKHLILPELNPPLTELLPLRPLPVSALKNPRYESLYSFTHFNPIQTQVFYTLYNTDHNVLLGAPTGSGKTIVAEIAIFRAFEKYKNSKVVYIAPLKALVKERIKDWSNRMEKQLGKNIVELTGDTSPDIEAILRSQIIVTTPEKWDSISRSWQTRDYVKDVVLIIIDEIHLLGEDRGPVIEVIVSRTNFITSHTKKYIRIVGLSTALANAQDLANWLGIRKAGLYNFKPSVRPVPLSVHISGFSGKHYCPRMATMNRPTYQAIRTYSPTTAAIIFVSSRRQTRLTALDLITYVAGDDNPKQFLHVSDAEMQDILYDIKDTNLKFCLAFGIGLHHAGLAESDRKIVEDLFLHRKIQILVATSTLAWGVNLPARLVVIKGTEYFDSKTKKYVDMPITDVLQMMGRAGRPQFDTEGIAVVLVHDIKKNFYKKFLYDPFPVESSLLNVLPDHINAEIVSGSLPTKNAAMDYLTWTYFYRRLLRNPTYYNLENSEYESLNLYLSTLIENALYELQAAACVSITGNVLAPTILGRISSFYYISYRTVKHFLNEITADISDENLLLAISGAYEFDQQPVRHNEDISNEELAKLCRYQPISSTYDSPYTKTFILLQAHIMRLPLPNSDYLTDTKLVLDQAARILQALLDYAAERGWLLVTLRLQLLSQSITQARWCDEPNMLILPHVDNVNIACFYKIRLDNNESLSFPVLKRICTQQRERLSPLREAFDEMEIEDISRVIEDLPEIFVQLHLQISSDNNQQMKDKDNNQQMKTILGKDWIDVFCNETYVLCINLQRICRKDSRSVYCPRYPKQKSEGWVLTLGSQSSNEVLAMKRATFRGSRSMHRLNFQVPPAKGRLILTLYIMSDTYIGLDQQFDLLLNVV